MDIDEFSEWLLEQMEERHLNCNKMAAMTGLTPVTIGYYITGTRSPTFASLKLILNALNKHVEIKDNAISRQIGEAKT